MGQLWRSFRAVDLSSKEEEDIGAILNQQELALFLRQSPVDQRHAYQVMITLRDSGHEDEDLLSAALLHDVGKSFRRMTRWERSIVVLVEALAPSVADKLTHGSGEGWSRPFVIKSRHAIWGAEAASEAGSSPLTVALVRSHHMSNQHIKQEKATKDTGDSDGFERSLALLSWADETN